MGSGTSPPPLPPSFNPPSSTSSQAVVLLKDCRSKAGASLQEHTCEPLSNIASSSPRLADRDHSPGHKRAVVQDPNESNGRSKKQRQMKKGAVAAPRKPHKRAIGPHSLGNKSPRNHRRRMAPSPSPQNGMLLSEMEEGSSLTFIGTGFPLDNTETTPISHGPWRSPSLQEGIKRQNIAFRETFSAYERYRKAPEPSTTSTFKFDTEEGSGLGALEAHDGVSNRSTSPRSLPGLAMYTNTTVTLPSTTRASVESRLSSRRSPVAGPSSQVGFIDEPFDSEQPARGTLPGPRPQLDRATIIRILADLRRKLYTLEVEMGKAASQFLGRLDEYVYITTEVLTMEKAFPPDGTLTFHEQTQFLSAFLDSRAAEAREKAASSDFEDDNRHPVPEQTVELWEEPPISFSHSSSTPSGQQEMRKLGSSAGNEPGYFQKKISLAWQKANIPA
ncbi:hypothetical protein DFP72DRAFT_908777 [Ephemerocybe angulata]|uniref:Uncharacterized protein n=1 Tax=Ephemerocybe angulata TaxID=980116 RepID=A0A8H6HRW3_9AGAR|nr:hypothetical protein DFP72DRAFT_908777 [Tulosesus angulatus]